MSKGLTIREIEIIQQANTAMIGLMKRHLSTCKALHAAMGTLEYIVSDPSKTMGRIEDMQRDGVLSKFCDLKINAQEEITQLMEYVKTTEILQGVLSNNEGQTGKSDREDLFKR